MHFQDFTVFLIAWGIISTSIDCIKGLYQLALTDETFAVPSFQFSKINK